MNTGSGGAEVGDDAPDAIPSADVSRGELREATFKSLRWATLARVAAETSALASAVVLAHLVPPSEFGRVAIAVIVSEFALALANEGVGSGLVRQRTIERAHVESAALLSLLIGIALALMTLLILPLATRPLFGDDVTRLFQMFSPTFIIASLGIVPLAMLERRLDFRRISLIEIATVVASSISSVALALAGLDGEAYVLGAIIGMTTWAALLLILGPSVLPRWRPQQMREIARFGIPAGLAGSAAVAYGNVDKAVCGATLSLAQVGFYYRAYALGVEYQNKISSIINRIIYPVYARTEDLRHMRDLRSRMVRINVVVMFPLLAFFIAGAPLIVPMVFGAQWEPAVPLAQILTVAGMARMINNGTPPLMLAAGRPRTLFVFNLYRVTFLGIAVYLATSHGLVAVCLAVAGFQVVTLVGSYLFMLKRLVGVTLGQLARDIGPALIASGAMLAVAFALREWLTAETAPKLAVLAIMGVISGPIYLLTIRILAKDAWDDLFMIVRRVAMPSRWRPVPAPAPPTAHT
ncbi:MAG: oligosaccharide flippase family protein [Chloroflexi bacterium]|nr:oligosaccharide flippase family protein [Chloroflexota bacterium]